MLRKLILIALYLTRRLMFSGNRNATKLLLITTIICLLLSVASLALHFLARNPRIAAVDAVKLISQYKGMEDVKRKQEERNRQLQANLDTLKNELTDAIDRHRQNRSANKNELKNLEEEIQARQRNLISYEQSIGDQMKKQDEELANALLGRVNDYIKRFGEKNRYTIIFASTQFGNIAYAHESVDITDEVLKGLNEEYLRR